MFAYVWCMNKIYLFLEDRANARETSMRRFDVLNVS